MDQDQVEGTLNQAAGTVQGKVGDMLGDSKSQIEARARAMAGQVQERYGAAAGQVRDAAASVTERITEQPLIAVAIAVGIGFLLGRLTAAD